MALEASLRRVEFYLPVADFCVKENKKKVKKKVKTAHLDCPPPPPTQIIALTRYLDPVNDDNELKCLTTHMYVLQKDSLNHLGPGVRNKINYYKNPITRVA